MKMKKVASAAYLNGFISLFTYNLNAKKAIHKIQDRIQKFYNKKTNTPSNASVHLLDLLLRPKDAVKRLAQPLAQLLIDIGTGFLCRNPRRAALQMRHRIALRHGRAVLVAR